MLSIVGYELCPAEMMASNPYGVNQKRVEEQYTTWIHSPGRKEILMCSIIMTFYGDKELVTHNYGDC
jgi:CBS domain-containing protein